MDHKEIITSMKMKKLQILQTKWTTQTIGDNKKIADFDTMYASLLSGDTVILLDGYPLGNENEEMMQHFRMIFNPFANIVPVERTAAV